MQIVVVGATGMVGSRITAEATGRGHDVRAVARRATPELEAGPATVVVADAHRDHDRLRAQLVDADAVVMSVSTRPEDAAAFERLTENLLDLAADTDTRILIVGGAGPLRTPEDPDRLFVDFVLPEWRDAAATSVTQLAICRRHPRADWIYLSPPADLTPGVRTGTYRRGGDTLLRDADGHSRISAEDLAVAVVDELETPAAEQHFTVAD